MLNSQKDAILIARQELFKLISVNSLLQEEIPMWKNTLISLEQHINTEYMQFIKSFNLIIKKNYPPDIESWEFFYHHLKRHSLKNMVQSLTNSITDPYIISNPTILRPKWFLNPSEDRVAKYMNYTPPVNQSKKKENENNYTAETNL